MHGIDQLLEAGQEPILGNADLPTLHPAHGQSHTGRAGNHQANTAARLFLVVGDQPFTRAAIALGEVDPHGRDDHAVFQFKRTDSGGGQKCGVLRCSHAGVSVR